MLCDVHVTRVWDHLRVRGSVPSISNDLNTLTYHQIVLEKRKEKETVCQHGYVQNAKLSTQVGVVRQHVQTVEPQKKSTRRRRNYMGHTICHLEIPTTDLKRSGEFYRKLFGWEIDYSWGPDYAIFSTGEGVLTGGGRKKRQDYTGKHNCICTS